MTDRQFLTSRDTLMPAKAALNGWPPEAREALAAALYASSTAGAGNAMTWAEFCARHGWKYEGVERFYRRADAALAAIAPYRAAQIAERDAARAEAARLREALEAFLSCRLMGADGRLAGWVTGAESGALSLRVVERLARAALAQEPRHD